MGVGVWGGESWSGGGTVGTMYFHLKTKTCGINVCYDKTKYCIYVRKLILIDPILS